MMVRNLVILLLIVLVNAGARFATGEEAARHWAYVGPRAAPPPMIRDTAWPQNAIDAFILARLEKESIAPSPPVDRERLLRRASLDLIGLPPALTEIDRFVGDRSPDAYERLIDRLLASPRYGERWATPWLDAARYADSNGYQRDGHRTIWPYRDWVIRALNVDVPFDRFTIEQIAGDLLPGATLEQQIATGFHRCTTVNVEAGTDEEENRVNQVFDRVNVTGTVWLGTTLECCQCHDHKYDPFTQRDYYQMFAFFNGTPKETYQRTKGSASLDAGGPEAALPLDPSMARQRTELTAQRQDLIDRLEQCLEDEASRLAAWEAAMSDPAKVEEAKLPANIRRLLAVATEKRNANQKNQIRNYFISVSTEAKKLQAEMDGVQKRLDALTPAATPVMTELAERRTSAILDRGDFLSPTNQVAAGTPKELPPMPSDAPTNRLGLGKWLVDPANPLTARVQVNRAWSQLFGRGIVASEEDLGTQAESPSHPELLDWLAVELHRRGWSVKSIHRTIVESATYRQSSKHRTDLAARDPNNLLLGRGPRIRLTAELVRDNALAASGQLSSRMHGPPVYPPQPDGVWRVTGAVDNTYRTSTAENAVRRGVYTVWRRSAPYPSFVNFDAPDRSACTVKRPLTSTPLQALTLQNDPVYVELAKALADRVIVEAAGVSLEDRLTSAFRRVLTRRPTTIELATLNSAYQSALNRYRDDAKAARQVGGKRELPGGVKPAEWGAWFNIAHMLLNLDETITKN